MTKQNQKQKILHYMKKNGVITPIEALRFFGCMRLGARIWDLRHDGHNIKSHLVTYRDEDGTPRRYNAYFLADEEVAG